MLKSSHIKPCIQLKEKIFRRSGSIQSETETSIIGSDIFFTNTLQLKEAERIASWVTNDTNQTTNQVAMTGTIKYSQWKLPEKNMIEEIE